MFRLKVEPNERNGLRAPCRLMVDKLTAVPRERLGERELVRLNQSVLVFVGLTASPGARSRN